MPPPQPNSPTPLPTALQPANVAMAEMVKGLELLRQSLDKTKGEAAQAGGGMAKAGAQWKSMFGQFMQSIQQSGTAMAFGINQVNKAIGDISSQVGRFVEMYNPTAMIRFKLAADDATAAIGVSLVPLLDRFTLVVRGIADGLASVTPAGKTLIAGLAAATVGFTVAAGAAVAFSSVMNSALGGIPAILGAIVGAGTGVAFAMKGLGEIQAIIEQVMGSATVVMNVLGQGAAQLATAFAPVFGIIGRIAEQVAGTFAGAMLNLLPTFERLTPAIGQFLEAMGAIMATNLSTNINVFSSLLDLLVTITPAVLGLVSAFSTVQSIIGQLLGIVLQVVAAGLKPFALIVEGFGTVLSAVAPMFAPLQEALGEVGELFRDLTAATGELWGEIASVFKDMLPNVTTPLELFAAAIKRVSEIIRAAVAEVREVLGLEKRNGQNSFQKNAGDGLAVRNVGTSSAEEFIKKGWLSAFTQGKNAPEITADGVTKIAVDLKELKDLVKRVVDKLPERLAAAIAEKTQSVANRVAPLTGYAGAAALDRIAGMMLHGK